jgi:hypothetical protein
VFHLPATASPFSLPLSPSFPKDLSPFLKAKPLI